MNSTNAVKDFKDLNSDQNMKGTSLSQVNLPFSKKKILTKKEQMKYQEAGRSEILYYKDFNVANLVCMDPTWLQYYIREIMGGRDPFALSYVTIRGWYSPSSGNFHVKGIWADIEDGDPEEIKFYHLIIPGDSSTILEGDWAYDGGYGEMAEEVELDMDPSGELKLPDDVVEVYRHQLIEERYTTVIDLYLAVTHPSGQVEMELLMRLGAKRYAELLTSPKEIKSEQ